MTSAGKTPSRAAVRAAKLIARSGSLRPLVFGSILREQAAAPWAEIIEQSTHAGEMAELLRECLYVLVPGTESDSVLRNRINNLLAELEREA